MKPALGRDARRVLRNGSLALVSILVAAQLIQPDRANPPVSPERSLWKDPRVDPRVGRILRRSCADCHSHETTWPWYSKISPVSWMVSRHVIRGRAKLNFSDWSGTSTDQLEEIYDSIAKKKMPLPSYMLLHPDARLSQAEVDLLTAWTDGKLTATLR